MSSFYQIHEFAELAGAYFSNMEYRFVSRIERDTSSATAITNVR